MTARLNPARAAYEGYAAYTGRKTFDGREMPMWEQLPRRIQMAWAAAFHAGLKHWTDVLVPAQDPSSLVGLLRAYLDDPQD